MNRWVRECVNCGWIDVIVTIECGCAWIGG
jgi:hypothetical protein